MKKSELFFSAIQVPVDFIMIVLAAVSAFTIRNIPQIITLKPKLYEFPFDIYIKVVLMTAPFFILIYAFEGLYNIRVTKKFWKQALKVFAATSIGLIIIIVTIFLKREWFSSRFIILAAWGLATFYVIFARYLLQLVQRYLMRKQGIGVHRVLLIGRNGKLGAIERLIRQNRNLGYQVIGQIDMASIRVIKEVREKKGIDEIFLCEPSITDEEQEKLIDYCAINNIVYKYIATTLQTSNMKLSVLGDEPIIEVQHTPLDGWGRILKRVFDVFASIFGIILTSPIMLLTFVAIWIEDGGCGPIIYKNQRVGDNGKKIFVYKFRYMQWKYCVTKENPQLEEAMKFEKELIKNQSIRRGPLYKIKNDPRKTHVGKFIERFSIDELPQFFNVLLGNMSMVGPRPHQEREVEKYMEYHRRLLTIKPGISGMAQISGRSDLDFEKEYKLDLYYIENWSLWLDVQICLKTIGVLFKKRRNL
ncbi:sugar transferase [Patescibacteria group bacterium]|nr:sugar transferase [Patescibacteria group bacterium]